jgi:hypothetical protein
MALENILKVYNVCVNMRVVCCHYDVIKLCGTCHCLDFMSYQSRPVGEVINQPYYGPNGRAIWGMPGLWVKGVTCTSAGSPSD